MELLASHEDTCYSIRSSLHIRNDCEYFFITKTKAIKAIFKTNLFLHQ